MYREAPLTINHIGVPPLGAVGTPCRHGGGIEIAGPRNRSNNHTAVQLARQLGHSTSATAWEGELVTMIKIKFN